MTASDKQVSPCTAATMGQSHGRVGPGAQAGTTSCIRGLSGLQDAPSSLEVLCEAHIYTTTRAQHRHYSSNPPAPAPAWVCVYAGTQPKLVMLPVCAM